MATAVNRIFAAKAMNQGQVCIAPDYVLIDETREDEFVSQFAKQVRASNFAEGSKGNPNWGKIITQRHVQRLKRLIDTSGGEVVCGGSSDIDFEAQHVPLTVIKNVPPDAAILHEEIFGPVLPIVPVKSMGDAIQYVKDREHPLALYIFSQDKQFQEKVLTECTSGGAAVNTCMEQINNKQAPFGGVGGSGMGQYHGKFGFDEFSHFRTVMYKTGTLPMIPHPEQQPSWMSDVALKFLVTGFMKPETKQKLKLLGTGALGLAGALVLRSRL
jgi:aldehyde dehydrogenase (NAD+)